MLTLQHLALDPATQVFFLAPLALIALDILTGIARALKTRSFYTPLLGDFARTNVLPYLALLMTFLIVPIMSGVPYIVAADSAKVALGLFCVSQLHSVLSNIAQLSGKSGWTDAMDNAVNSLLEKIYPSVARVTPSEPPTSEPAQ